MEYLVIIVCYLVTIFTFRTKKPAKAPVPDVSYTEIMDVIDSVIIGEIRKKNEDYETRGVKIINDFEKDLKDLTLRVMSSFSPDFMEDVLYYHPREFITQYVSRQAKTFFIEYSKKNLIQTTKKT